MPGAGGGECGGGGRPAVPSLARSLAGGPGRRGGRCRLLSNDFFSNWRRTAALMDGAALGALAAPAPQSIQLATTAGRAPPPFVVGDSAGAPDLPRPPHAAPPTQPRPRPFCPHTAPSRPGPVAFQPRLVVREVRGRKGRSTPGLPPHPPSATTLQSSVPGPEQNPARAAASEGLRRLVREGLGESN